MIFMEGSGKGLKYLEPTAIHEKQRAEAESAEFHSGPVMVKNPSCVL